MALTYAGNSLRWAPVPQRCPRAFGADMRHIDHRPRARSKLRASVPHIVVGNHLREQFPMNHFRGKAIDPKFTIDARQISATYQRIMIGRYVVSADRSATTPHS